MSIGLFLADSEAGQGGGVWPPPEEFADRLARLRRRRRATNEEIAAAAGVHPNTVSNWNSGQKPEGMALLNLARYFDVTPEWLLTGTSPKASKPKAAAEPRPAIPANPKQLVPKGGAVNPRKRKGA